MIQISKEDTENISNPESQRFQNISDIERLNTINQRLDQLHLQFDQIKNKCFDDLQNQRENINDVIHDGMVDLEQILKTSLNDLKTMYKTQQQQQQQNQYSYQYQENIMQQYFTCQICQQKMEIQKLVTFCDCKFKICMGCFDQYINDKGKIAVQILCPGGCQKILKQQVFIKFFKSGVKSKYYKQKQIKFFQQAKLISCPKACKQGFIQEFIDAFDKKAHRCTTCQQRYCIRCLDPQHQNQCNNQTILFVISTLNYAVCQKCGRLVDRIAGCKKMTCTCKYLFCYECWGQFKGYQLHKKCPPEQQWRKNVILQQLKANLKQKVN